VQQLPGDEADPDVAFCPHRRAPHGSCGEAGHLAHELALTAHRHQEFAWASGEGGGEFLGLACTLQYDIYSLSTVIMAAVMNLATR
jgi:hypothetical protein